MNIERTRIHFLATFSLPSPSSDLKVPTEKAETTACFSICESQLPLAREIHRLLRVPKDNHIFEYP